MILNPGEDSSKDGDACENIIELEIGPDHAGDRLDKILPQLYGDFSRSRIQALIEDGRVEVNGRICTTSSHKAREHDRIKITIPLPADPDPKPESIPLDIVFEDDDLLVINKPAGLVVHPGAGNHSGTLVNALLFHCGAGLSGIGGVARPGIVHRLDKDTSGLMVAAKNDFAHKALAAQLESRSLSRIYHAIIFKTPFPPKGTVDQPIGRHAQHRLKMSVSRTGRPARTHYQVLENFGNAASLIECKLDTGRTHQIRVHMEHLGHSILGDALYGPQPTALRAMLSKAHDPQDIESILSFPRQALHARRIAFLHPRNTDLMHFERDMPEDMAKLLKHLNNKI